MLTLYTTPVVYLYMDRLRLRALGETGTLSLSGETRATALATATISS